MSTYGLCNAFSATLAWIAGIIVLIFLSPFLIALAIGTVLAIWQHSFSLLWSGVYYALLCDVAIVIIAILALLTMAVHDKFFDN